MRHPEKAPTRIAIATHPSLPEARMEALEISTYLEKHGIEAVLCASIYEETLLQYIQAGEPDILIAIGGDGTLLRAGHLCASHHIPILGVNLGRFGFLTEVERGEWQPALQNLFNSKYWLEERMMLYTEHIRENEILGSWTVLNDVVVCRGQMVRPIQIDASVDGYVLASYVADGLIAATPTGSTAYALAVGGPIMPPELRNILVIPVAPHLSVDRAIILAEGASVTFTVHTSHQAVISADGQTPDTMLNGDSVKISVWDHPALFIRFHDPGYFYRNLTRHMEQHPSTSAGIP